MAIPGIVYSADWIGFGSVSADVGDATMFIDMDSISYYTQRPHIKVYWVLTNYSHYQTIKVNSFRSDITKKEINCHTRKMNIAAYYLYAEINGKGRLVDSYERSDDDWESIVPGSIADAQMKIVCVNEFQGSNHTTPALNPPRPTEPNNKPYNSSAVDRAINRYASGSNSDLRACMSNKVNIYTRRLRVKDPDTFYANGEVVIDAATKATIKTCRAEAKAVRNGPSYDCTKASAITEHAICATPSLSRLDVEFNNAVSAAKAMTSYRKRITDDLRIWITERNNCGADVNCIRQSYVNKQREIEGL